MSFDSLLSQLDPARRGPEFERLCRWYLNNAPEYRGRFKRVWLWAEWVMELAGLEPATSWVRYRVREPNRGDLSSLGCSKFS